MQSDLVATSKFLSYVLRHHPAAIAIFQVIVVINAAMKAKNGEMYRYPFNLRLL